jgi:hypothetical protein
LPLTGLDSDFQDANVADALDEALNRQHGLATSAQVLDLVSRRNAVARARITSR